MTEVREEGDGLLEGLDRLETELGTRGVEAELLVVGGALMSLVFRAEPGTRRPSEIFGDVRELEECAGIVGREAGLPADWLAIATRRLVESGAPAAGGREGRFLRVYAPAPDHALAMKCAEWDPRSDDRRAVEADLRYLLRLSGIRTPEVALERAGVYFTERQLHDALPELLTELLS